MHVQHSHRLYTHEEEISPSGFMDKMLHTNFHCISRFTSYDKKSQMQVCTVAKTNQ